MPCVYKTITLSPSESYVLPAGAEIVFCSDSASISSLNDCATIPDTPPAKCYTVSFGNGLDEYDSNNRGFAWEAFTYNGIEVSFDTNNTRLGTNTIFGIDQSLVSQHASEMWSRLSINQDLAPLLLGFGVYGESWARGEDYGIKVKLYDLGVGVPTMRVIDLSSDNRNALTGQRIRNTILFEECDCGAYSEGGTNGQYVAAYGDIYPTGPV